jgi:hypothetical protein
MDLQGLPTGSQSTVDSAMKPAVVCPQTAQFFSEGPEQRHMAVLFRGRVYVASPRHMDAINLALAGMTDLQRYRVCNRIADGKEKMLFGSAFGDGSGWEWDEKNQVTRLAMYGFD